MHVMKAVEAEVEVVEVVEVDSTMEHSNTGLLLRRNRPVAFPKKHVKEHPSS